MWWPFSAITRSRARREASTRRKVVIAHSADHYLDAGAVRSRAGTPQGELQYVVTLTRPLLPTIILTQGPSGSTARQVFENVVPKAGEVMTMTDNGVVRGVKRGKQ